MKKPSKKSINAIDLAPLEVYLTNNHEYFRSDAGVEHYKLLAGLSFQFNDKIIVEIGSLSGMGTIALSANPNNKVITYDIRDYQWKNHVPPNAERRLVKDGYMDDVVKASLIFYDAAHGGKEEQDFLDELIERDWHGMIVWDDIHLNKEMEEFWQNCIKAGYKVDDWTSVGHSVGTGVMYL